MVGRRRAATGFRPSAPTTPSRAPSRRQTAAMLAGVLAVSTGIAVASFAVKPDKARSFDLFYGSVYIDDNLSPVAVDLSSGKATVRLTDATTAVSAARSVDLDVVPLTGGTLMLDPTTGEFNMLDSSGFVLKPTGGGVRLPQLPDSQDELTTAVPSGDSAYLVRPSRSGTAIYLVGQSTVASAIGTTTQVKARAQATLDQTAADDPYMHDERERRPVPAHRTGRRAAAPRPAERADGFQRRGGTDDQPSGQGDRRVRGGRGDAERGRQRRRRRRRRDRATTSAS